MLPNQKKLILGGRRTTIVFLTSGSTWTVPLSWNNTNNVVRCIGGGGAGGAGGAALGGGAGSSGSYVHKANIVLTPGQTVNIGVGAAAQDTWFGGAAGTNFATSPVAAKAGITAILATGAAAPTGSAGDLVREGIVGGTAGGGNGQGGCGAGGPNGIGTTSSGSNGGNADGGTPAGQAGGAPAAAGLNGAIWIETATKNIAGPGSAGGGRTGTDGAGGAGGSYGASGGGGRNVGAGGGNGGAGAPGIIVVEWTN